MINHHPSHELLNQFVNGQLPASVSAAIAIHADLCPVCQEQINHLTHHVADAVFNDKQSHPTEFEEQFLHQFQVDGNNEPEAEEEIDFESLIASITLNDDVDIPVEITNKTIDVKGIEYQLPRALNSISLGNWAGVGKINRSRLQLDEGGLHSSLLQIQAGGSVPSHTHKGMELTLLLDGSFQDEMGSYVKGDFIWLTNEHKHNPVSQEGCLCLTVSDDSLVFTEGLAKLLNPIGGFIY